MRISYGFETAAKLYGHPLILALAHSPRAAWIIVPPEIFSAALLNLVHDGESIVTSRLAPFGLAATIVMNTDSVRMSATGWSIG